jgi:hypothetical protein
MSELNKLIDQYILENPRAVGETGYYSRIASKFNIHPEKARKRWRVLQSRAKQVGLNSVNYLYVEGIAQPKCTYTYSTNGDQGTYESTVSEPIEDLDDLIRVCNIDTTKYSVTDYEVKAYNAWIKNSDNQIETKQLYSVKAHLKVKKLDNDIKIQKNLLIEEIKKHSPKTVHFYSVDQKNTKRNHALEINIPDLHIGKLAWGKETGEDYDIKIAVERYKKAVDELVSRVNTNTLAKIILPVGNDLINVDNASNTTTAGTSVSCDSRFGKMFQTAKTLLIETIDKLCQIAPVDVIIIPGNHDSISTFTLGEVLDAWYHNTANVTITNTHTPRKYYQYGQNLIMYTHGHREKLNDLGIICATEQPLLWAATKYRRVHVGHFHHSKQVKFVDVQEYPGFTVKILNSLSSNDAWHAEKGYLSLKGAEAFLYHKDKGLVANYYYLHQ